MMAVLLCGLLSGCGNNSAKEQKEEVHVIVKTPILPMEYGDSIDESYDFLKLALDKFAAQYEKAKVTYEIAKFAYTDEAKYIEETFDTKEAADLLFGDYFNMSSYIHTGRVVPLDDIITEEMKAELPDMCYPMTMYAKNNQGDTHIMVLLRSRGSLFFDKNHNFNLNTKEGIETLEWIKNCYDADYFPMGAENMEISENSMLRDNNQLAIFHINNSKKNPEWGYVNFPSMDGKGYATSFISGFEIFDNGNEKKIQTAKDFLKFLYADEKLMDISACGLPVSQAVTKRHINDVYMLEAYQNNTKNIVDFTENNPNWSGVREVFYTHIYDLLTGKRTPKEVAADIDKDCNTAIEKGRQNSTLHE